MDKKCTLLMFMPQAKLVKSYWTDLLSRDAMKIIILFVQIYDGHCLGSRLDAKNPRWLMMS